MAIAIHRSYGRWYEQYHTDTVIKMINRVYDKEGLEGLDKLVSCRCCERRRFVLKVYERLPVLKELKRLGADFDVKNSFGEGLLDLCLAKHLWANLDYLLKIGVGARKDCERIALRFNKDVIFPRKYGRGQLPLYFIVTLYGRGAYDDIDPKKLPHGLSRVWTKKRVMVILCCTVDLAKCDAILNKDILRLLNRYM